MLPPPLPPGVGGMPRLEPPSPRARARAFLREHPRLSVAGGVALFLLVIYPFAAGALVAHLVESRLSAKLGRPVTVGHARGGLGTIVIEDLTIPGAPGGPALATIRRLTIPFGAALGLRSAVEVVGLHVDAHRGGPEDNVGSILATLRGRRPDAGAGPGGKTEGAARPESEAKPEPAAAKSEGGPSVPDVTLVGASILVHDEASHLQLAIPDLSGEIHPGARMAFHLRGLKGGLALGGEGEGPKFGADELDVETPLTGLRPSGIPALRVAGGHASPLPQLALTGIAGVIGPPPAGVAAGDGSGMVIDLRGSYGGARETLWTAKGRAEPAHGTGKLALRAEQFSLGRIADVLPPSVLRPADTTLDAALDLNWAGDAVSFAGDLAMVGLSLQSDALAVDPVENVSVGLTLRGTVYPLARRLELERAEARVRDVTARLSGHVALPAGTFKFTNGKTLSVVPDIDLHFSVPRVACSKLLSSIPPALVPRLQGFVLQGFFGAEVGFKADFANLDDLDLTGKVGIDGCKVVKAPDDVKSLAEPQTLVINVEVPKLPGSGGQPGETDTIPVVVGPDNPDFTPYDQISPYLVGSIMTTEDNGFFKHHGWVSSEFKSALKRNLKGGGFRLGASSITMQMTKNVLLTKDKTLSRKLQELFLVWYLEQILPKERILELYFNAIEFGPRIYGIGAATRHYFGKRPSELTPLEAAFFSSILPSPKRRYVQFCHGSLSAQWDRYVRRILAKVHERGRITDDEYAAVAQQPFVFDRKEATFT
ncbi:MAG TPA: biosynthetic peptidoglycan transglycosylase, partial [Polyangia bacterium]|nr:biosynthetic peptidoglycan transglycosylase [Polyangia bacterium]